MKIKADYLYFSEALSAVSGACGDGKNNPALSGVLLTADGSTLKLAAYNLEYAITAVVGDVCVEVPGSIVIPKEAVKTLSQLSGEEISIFENDSLVHVVCGKSKSKYTSIPASDFPALPVLDGESATASFCSEQFINKIKSVLFACAKSESRPEYTGVLLDGNGETLNFAGGDGYKIAYCETESDVKIRAIIPAIAMNRVINISKKFEKIALKVGKKFAEFRTDSYSIITKLVQGEYVDYRSLPVSDRIKFEVDAVETARTIDRIRSVYTSFLPMTISVSPEGVELRMKSEVAECSDGLDVKTDEILTIGTNPAWLSDILKSCPNEKAEIGLESELSPLSISANGWRCILQPMRFRG